MMKTLHSQPVLVTCLLCGRPAERTICFCCQARIQGEAIEAKREVEKKGRAETTRH